MFYNLAFKNVLRSFKDYSVYFLTLTFGVCIFYVFNSLDSQQVLLDFTQQQSTLVYFMLETIAIVSAIISVVLAGLILYANNFILRRRKREFGLYMTLGIQRRRIALMLLVETLVVGVLSLAAGLALGLLLSQTLSVLISWIYHVPVINYHFVISFSSMRKTLLYFAIIFLVVGVLNMFSISGARLIKLLQSNRRNEGTFLTRHLWVSVVLFVLAAALLIGAYIWILKIKLYTLDLSLLIIIAMGCLGTLLFFLSLSGFLLKLSQLWKGFYYKHLNLFVVRQLTSKLGSAFGSMAMVCIMLLLTIGAFGSAFVTNDATEDNLVRATRFDVTYRSDRDLLSQLEAIEEDDGFLTDAYQFKTYDTGVRIAEFTYAHRELLPNWKAHDYEQDYSTFNAMSIKDYNACMRIAGLDEINISPDEFAVISTFKPMVDVFTLGIAERQTLTIAGRELTIRSITDQPARVQDVDGIEAILLLPDDVAQQLEVAGYSLVANYPEGVTDGQKRAEAIATALYDQYTADGSDGEYSIYCSTREMLHDNNIASYGTIIFIGIYIGLVNLVASAAVLAIQQLSQASDDQERYALLRKLGTDERMISAAITRQIALYFLMPLALALVHSCVGLYVVLDVLASFGSFNVLAMLLFIAFFLLVIYGGYFLLTCWGAKRVVRERIRSI